MLRAFSVFAMTTLVASLSATAIVLLSLWPLRKLADAVGLRASRTHRLELELSPEASVSSVLSRLEAAGGEMLSARIAEEEDIRRLEVIVQQRERDLGKLVEAAASAPEVRTATIAP